MNSENIESVKPSSDSTELQLVVPQDEATVPLPIIDDFGMSKPLGESALSAGCWRAAVIGDYYVPAEWPTKLAADLSRYWCMMERRFESRFLCADVVRVDWRAGENSRTVEAVLEDISALGACVQVEERIPRGTEISILVGLPGEDSQKPMRFSGLASYCVFRDYGYFVGIQFADETRWSSGLFEPQHLINLEALTSLCAPENLCAPEKLVQP